MKSLTFIALLFCAQLLYAQDNDRSSKSSWGISAGWTEGNVYDEHTSPLLYRSDVLTMGGIYRHQGSFLFEIALTLKIGTNRPKQLGHRTGIIEETPNIYGEINTYEVEAYPFLSMAAGDLKVRGLWQVAQGHQVGVSINARHIYTGMAIDTWLYSQLDIAPEYQYSYPVLDGNLEAGISLPILSAVVRPNYAFDPSLPDLTNYYKGYLRTGTSVVSLNKLFNPRLHAGYTWHFKDGKSLGARYFTTWTSYSDPRPLRMFEHGLEVTYFFK